MKNFCRANLIGFTLFLVVLFFGQRWLLQKRTRQVDKLLELNAWWVANYRTNEAEILKWKKLCEEYRDLYTSRLRAEHIYWMNGTNEIIIPRLPPTNVIAVPAVPFKPSANK